MNNKLMFKKQFLEEDAMKALHVTKDEVMMLVAKGEFSRYKCFGKYEYMFTDIYNYSKRKEKEDDNKNK